MHTCFYLGATLSSLEKTQHSIICFSWMSKQGLVVRKSFQVASLTDGGPEKTGTWALSHSRHLDHLLALYPCLLFDLFIPLCSSESQVRAVCAHRNSQRVNLLRAGHCLGLEVKAGSFSVWWERCPLLSLFMRLTRSDAV